MRIANISNNTTVSQADQTAIINSLTFTETVPNRSYARASANEITSKTILMSVVLEIMPMLQ